MAELLLSADQKMTTALARLLFLIKYMHYIYRYIPTGARAMECIDERQP
jgi:hypothetical protein